MPTDEQKQEQQAKQEWWAGFPEAPYSDSFKWIDGEGFEHLSTVRAYSGPDLYSASARLIANILETGGKAPNQRPPQAPGPAQSPAVAQLVAEGEKPAAAALQASIDAIPAAPGGQQWQTMNVTRMVIKPEPGDVYTLELYQSGHKWPDLRVNKRKLAVVQGYIKHITSLDASKPTDTSINAVAYYCNGKEKDGGGYWLDLHHLRPAA